MKAIRVLGVFVLVILLAGLVLGTSCGGEGPAGVGIQSVVNNGNGTFTLNLTDGSNFTTDNLTGIQSIVNNGDGTLTLNLSDGSSVTTDNLTGPQGGQGLAGVGIQSVVNNGDGTFTLKMTDGSSFTTPNLTGPQGQKGDKGDPGVQGPSAFGTSFSVGGIPSKMCFDGTNIWVTAEMYDQSYAVVKLQPSDGTILQTIPIDGGNPEDICFDGTNIWVVSSGNTVTKIQASNGTIAGSFSVGSYLQNICFDGTNIWVTDTMGYSIPFNPVGGRIIRLNTSGVVLGETAVSGVKGICYDGASDVWVTTWGGTVARFKASDGSPNGTITGFSEIISDIFFDGTSIWVTEDNFVHQIRVSDNAVLGTFLPGLITESGSEAYDVFCYDGTNIYVACYYGQDVVKLRASDGYRLNTLFTGNRPLGICFDGSNVWVVLEHSDVVTKLPA